ncbi:hypothetical protein [Chitinolyticbacter albus]|uniref:hypothetical protein n=1 Tax=Chitinolyticbacter albus TaxID=2961951 RepID=UPI00210BEE90|nr:hypothetical protein [Chitinolyticbacter albus]
MRNALIPVSLIVIGAGWLVNSLSIAPAVSWIVVFGLVIAGAAVLVIDGANRSSRVSGPMLIAGGAAVFAHQFYAIGWSVLLPLLLMLLGVLMLLVRVDGIPKLEKPEPMRLPGQDDDAR